MPRRARITQTAGTDHEDFTEAIAAVSDSDHDDYAHPAPASIPSETNYIPQEPGPHATDDELREASSLIILTNS